MDTLGQQLKAARMRKKLTASEAAKGTRIKIQHIEAIENDDFRDIAAPAYAKGFIRIYAEFLGLDPAPLVKDYVDRHVPKERTPLLPDDPPPSKAARFFDYLRRPRAEKPSTESKPVREQVPEPAPEPEPEPVREPVPEPPPKKKRERAASISDELELTFDEDRAPPRISMPGEEKPPQPPFKDRIKEKVQWMERLKQIDVKVPRLKWTRKWAVVYGVVAVLFVGALLVVQRSGPADDTALPTPVLDVPEAVQPPLPGALSLPGQLPVVELLPEPYLE